MLIGGENMFPHRLRRVNRSVIWFIVITNISVDWIVMPLDQSVRSNILCSFYSLGYKVSNKICLHFFWALHVYFKDQILQTQNLLIFDKNRNI